jgi:hypothetical protein
MDGENKKSLMKRFKDLARRILGRKPSPPPADPYAYRMAPVREGRKAAAAQPSRRSKTILTAAFHHAGTRNSFPEFLRASVSPW